MQSTQSIVYLMHVRHSSFTDEASFYLEDEGLNPGELVNPNRPNDSYCGLIRRALLASPRQRLFLHEIYDYLSCHYSYFRLSGNGWKNSVRHALSTGKEFLRIKESRKCTSRGSEWCLRDSAIGMWYISVNECKFHDVAGFELSHENININQMIEFSNLIPGLCNSMSPKNTPNNPWDSVDMQDYPQHLLGIVPNPDFFACPQSSYQVPVPPENYEYSKLLQSPKSHPSTPIRK